VIERVLRNYLEITSLDDLKVVMCPNKIYSVTPSIQNDFELNKFFYKQVGKKYQWVDRLSWSNEKWIEYISKKSCFTYILRENNELAGYYELIHNELTNEVEIPYFGILEEYFKKRLGGFLLTNAIKNSFLLGAKRIWVHTCSLDHKNALNNYLARGMRVFKTETLKRKVS
jgi:hypothetical protein